MTSQKKNCIQWVVLFIVAASTIGCSNKRLGLERNRLMQENGELRAALQRAEDDLAVTESERTRLVDEVNRLSQSLTIQPAVASTGFEQIKGVEIERTHGQIKVKVPGDVLFLPGKVSLRSASKRTLDQIAAIITSQYPDKTIGIEGYTDTDPIRKSKWKDNLELSLQRAAAVNRYLQTKGIDAKRMYAAGWGKHHPRQTKAKSRRVEIIVSSI